MALSKKLKRQISSSFSKIKSPVEIMLFVSGKYPKVEKGMESALKEITSLSRKLSFKKYRAGSPSAKKYDVKRGPVIVLHGKEKGKIRFLGFPSGYLFPVFIMDILEVSGAKQKVVGAAAAEKVPHAKTSIEVFAMPPDKYSPIAGKMAHDVAFFNPNVTADVIDALLFPELTRKYGVKEIPTTIINGKKKIFGAVPFAKLVEMLEK